MRATRRDKSAGRILNWREGPSPSYSHLGGHINPHCYAGRLSRVIEMVKTSREPLIEGECHCSAQTTCFSSPNILQPGKRLPAPTSFLATKLPAKKFLQRCSLRRCFFKRLCMILPRLLAMTRSLSAACRVPYLLLLVLTLAFL